LIITLAGTLSTLTLLARLTVTVLVAALVSVTVQVALCAEVSVAGVQLHPDNCAGATTLSVEVRDTPLADAVITAVSSLVTAPTVAVNPTLVAPAATVTLAGTPKLALLSDSATTNPPIGAGPLRVTVQALAPGAFTLAGAHVRPLSVTGGGGCVIVIVPPLSVVGIELPETVEAIVLVIDTATLGLVVPAAMVRFAMPICPFAIAVAFTP
jgi:hypothetical protein